MELSSVEVALADENKLGVAVPDWVAPDFPAYEVMLGEYCRLEPADAGKHADSLFNANGIDVEAAMWHYLPYGPFASRTEYTEWLESVCQQKDPQFYAIIDLKQNRAVGLASYLRIMPGHGSIEVGHLAYSPLLQRSIAATEAMYLMMKKAFAAGYRRYEWKCNALNKPSCRAALRLGFSFEGIFRQALVTKGRNRDTAWFAMIDKEWPALEQAYLQWLKPDNFNQAGEQQSRLSQLTRPLLHQSKGMDLS